MKQNQNKLQTKKEIIYPFRFEVNGWGTIIEAPTFEIAQEVFNQIQEDCENF